MQIESYCSLILQNSSFLLPLFQFPRRKRFLRQTIPLLSLQIQPLSFDQVHKLFIPFHLLYINPQHIRNDGNQVMRRANPIVTTANPFLHAPAQSFIELLADVLLESRFLGNCHLLDLVRFLDGEIRSSDVRWVDDCVEAFS